MLTCEITDIANSDCQGTTQVFDSLFYPKDECKSNEPDDTRKQNAKKKSKNIAFSPQNIKVYNECTDVETINSFNNICKPISPPMVTSTTPSMMAANLNKRRKKCRREYGHHKKHAKASDPVQEASCPVLSADPIAPKVTPIFVWANVDDTKIVHVLCEDYDKRNRIRLTRTAKGWRSVPLIESLEKCRQMVASQSPLDSASPRLVHNSPTTSDNRLQTDKLSNYPIENEFSNKGESIGVVADSTNQDHTFNEAVSLPSNSGDDAFSSDEDGQQENLRCMINKMQSDSLYSDEECETSVSTTQEDKIMSQDVPCEGLYSSENHADSDNVVTNRKTEEIVTSPSHKTVQESSLNQLSSNFPDNLDIMCQSSNSEVSNDIDKTVSSPNLPTSSEDRLHQDLNTDEVTNSEIILELLKRDDVPKIAEASTSYSPAAVNNDVNFSFDNHNQAENMDQPSDDMKEHIALSQQVTSSEFTSRDLHKSFSDDNSNTCVASENDTVFSTQQLSASNCISNGSPDNRKNCCLNTSNEFSLPTEISVGANNIPDINNKESLSNNFIDSNSNIINYSSINDSTPSTIEEALISSRHKRLLDDEIGESSSDQWTDNNSNIILESQATDEILLNIEDTPTSPCVSSPKIIPIDHLEISMTNNENICSPEMNKNHTDSDHSQSVNSNNSIDLNNDCTGTNLNIIHQSEIDVARPLSTSLSPTPSPDNEISLQEKYTNLSKTENSILSTLLQTDIIIGKQSEENIRKKSISEANKNLPETLDLLEVSSPASTLESAHQNSNTENKVHQQEMLEEHSRTMEFLYRSYFESPFMIQDNDTRELLQSLHANNQCIDLSTQRKNIVEENGDKSISVDMLMEEKSNPSNFRLHEIENSIKLACRDDEGLCCHKFQNNCNPSNVKAEVVYNNETSSCEKNKLDTTVQKVPLCQSLKSSNKCINTRRPLIRKQSKLLEDDNIPDEALSKELSSNELPSIDIKPGHQNNVPRKDLLFSSDKSQVKPTKLFKYQLPELVISKVPMQEKEKPVISAKMKPNPVTLPTKEKSTALDPLEQLKDVLSNPMYSVPDPLLVPKARLPALVTCPGREIPRLLARHTQNFSYVSILSDPDVLVVSLSHLRSLMTKPLNENDIQEYQKHTEEIRSRLRLELLNYKAGLENASLFGAGWNDYHLGPSPPSVQPSKPVSSLKSGMDDLFRGLSATCNPLNLCYPADMGRDINGNCGTPFSFEKGPLPWSNEIFSGPKANPPTYDPCGVSWNDQLCTHLGCFQTASGTCSLGKNDLLYCPFDSQFRNSFPPYLHSSLSCANSTPVLRDFGAKNCLPEFYYPWMDITRSVDDKGHHQHLENPNESLQYSTKSSQPLPKLGMELKMESASVDECERTNAKTQSKESSAADNLPEKRSQSVEPKIKVRQHLVDPNRRPLLLNPQLRSPYESSVAPFLRPWNSEGFPHPFWFR